MHWILRQLAGRRPMANISLALGSDTNLPESRFTRIARDLERDLARSGIRTQPASAAKIPGERGEPVTVGVLILALISHGAVNALIECLKAYLQREKHLKIKLTVENKIIEIDSLNISSKSLKESLSLLVSPSHK